MNLPDLKLVEKHPAPPSPSVPERGGGMMSTATENRLRLARLRSGPTVITEEALTCPRGHVLEGENLGVKPSGKRYCRRCEIERGRERRALALTEKAEAAS